MPKPSLLQISKIKSKYQHEGVSVSESSESVESKVRTGKRRSFPAAYKLKVVREAAACTGRGEVHALLRREGLYSSHLGAWRKQLALSGSDGLGSRKRGRKPKHDAKDLRIAELEKGTARLTARLSLAEKLIALQKKASEILGIDLESADDN